MFLDKVGGKLTNHSWIERGERERLAWLSKLTQQATHFACKRDTKTTRSHFFHFAQPNREENRA